MIVLDRNMPHMSGDECIRILKKDPHWQRIPVLFLTAQSDIVSWCLDLPNLVQMITFLNPLTLMNCSKGESAGQN